MIFKANAYLEVRSNDSALIFINKKIGSTKDSFVHLLL